MAMINSKYHHEFGEYMTMINSKYHHEFGEYMAITNPRYHPEMKKCWYLKTFKGYNSRKVMCSRVKHTLYLDIISIHKT
jgi:hypothetical protein